MWCVFKCVRVLLSVICCVVLYGLFLCFVVLVRVFGFCVCVVGCGVRCDVLMSYMRRGCVLKCDCASVCCVC